MLPATHRMTGAAQFRYAVRQGSRAGGRLLVVHVASTSAETEPLVGFVVSKAIGNAVARNLVKRRLRHAMRPLLEGLSSGRLIVVRAQAAAAASSYDELRDELARCLSRAVERADRQLEAAAVTA